MEYVFEKHETADSLGLAGDVIINVHIYVLVGSHLLLCNT